MPKLYLDAPVLSSKISLPREIIPDLYSSAHFRQDNS